MEINIPMLRSPSDGEAEPRCLQTPSDSILRLHPALSSEFNLRLAFLKRFRNYSVLLRFARNGFPWEKTTKSSWASVYAYCKTAAAPRILLLVFVWMVSSGCSAQNQPGATVPESPTPQPPAKPPGFFARLAEFYRQDWHGTASQGPAPPRRGLPSPLESPPFPNSDWSYGGSPVIGEADTNSYPLMTAWNQARSRTKVYGWVGPTGNFSTSANSNAPEANDVYSNRFEMNQL